MTAGLYWLRSWPPKMIKEVSSLYMITDYHGHMVEASLQLHIVYLNFAPIHDCISNI